ncbi:MAG: EAL domain-containing protein [Campylobacterota bacterium]|nr:EAL domain-containing protein [Campylobacterota bacterium]
MKIDKNILNIYFMLLITLVIPLIVGLIMQNFTSFRYVSLPLHSTIESMGAVIAFILSGIIFVIYKQALLFNHFHRASFALISMGVFDAFHAIVLPGELFVWLHSLAIFFGGILFSLVWVPDNKVTNKIYLYTPFIVLIVSIFIAVISLLSPSLVPQMINENKEFTDTANLLNMIGGIMYVVASFYFIKKYLQDSQTDDLLFSGLTMLFGSAGVLFFFSSLWDLSWWFWHMLRFGAYIVSLYFMLRLFSKNMRKLETTNISIKKSNTELKMTVKLLEEYKSAISQGSIISIADLSGHITYANDQLLKVTGYTKDELLGQQHSILRDPDTPKSLFKEMWDTIQSKKTFKGLIKNRKKDGSSFYAKITIVPILNHKGEILEYLALRDDVTELVNSQTELKKHFYTDRLTGLNNRFKLNEDMNEILGRHVSFINIDNFKSVNDFYGQEFGDKVISKLSNIILNISYDFNYSIYRNHGDEFAIVSSKGEEFNVFKKHIQDIITYISNISIKIENVDLDITLSAGIANDIDDISKVDIALKEAKRLNKSSIVYSENLDTNKIFETNIQWSKKIKEALTDDRIEIVLQPLYSNKENKVLKYESLVRLIEKNGEVISPFHFLDVAKRTKLYGQITRRVVKKAFRVLNETDKEISINICAEDVFDDETRNYLLNMLRETEYSKRVVIELVESEGIESFSDIKLFIDEIKSQGAKLAIDDFGTGYSNFEYLLKLNADYIKIDGSMIKNIDTDPNSYSVVETIVSFANKNNMKVIAEFVSSKEIQEKVEELGIDFSQGYYIDKPKFFEEIGE